jgi:hypothetical protein
LLFELSGMSCLLLDYLRFSDGLVLRKLNCDEKACCRNGIEVSATGFYQVNAIIRSSGPSGFIISARSRIGIGKYGNPHTYGVIS